jgi:hypothetical protein
MRHHCFANSLVTLVALVPARMRADCEEFHIATQTLKEFVGLLYDGSPEPGT